MQAVVYKGGLRGPCIRKFVYITYTGIYELLGLCFSLGDQRCLARCANLARQLSSYPYSIWNRSAYKVKHIHENIFILHRQTPQPEILYLYLYITVQEKRSHIPHVFFACEREAKYIGIQGRSRCGTRLPTSVLTELNWLTLVWSKRDTRMLGFHWVMRSPFYHPYCNRH